MIFYVPGFSPMDALANVQLNVFWAVKELIQLDKWPPNTKIYKMEITETK